jgi:hypothetical protein
MTRDGSNRSTTTDDRGGGGSPRSLRLTDPPTTAPTPERRRFGTGSEGLSYPASCTCPKPTGHTQRLSGHCFFFNPQSGPVSRRRRWANSLDTTAARSKQRIMNVPPAAPPPTSRRGVEYTHTHRPPSPERGAPPFVIQGQAEWRPWKAWLPERDHSPLILGIPHSARPSSRVFSPLRFRLLLLSREHHDAEIGERERGLYIFAARHRRGAWPRDAALAATSLSRSSGSSGGNWRGLGACRGSRCWAVGCLLLAAAANESEQRRRSRQARRKTRARLHD